MKVKEVIYNKTFALGNYQNEKLGVVIELNENEDPGEAMKKARDFVEFNHKIIGLMQQLDDCDRVMNNSDNYTGKEIMLAKDRSELIKKQMQEGVNLLKA